MQQWSPSFRAALPKVLVALRKALVACPPVALLVEPLAKVSRKTRSLRL